MGCDLGSPDLEPAYGPELRVVSTHPADGAGTDCPATDLACGVPRDTTVAIRFDRFLLPSTAVRQSFFVYTGAPGNVVPATLLPDYDLIERVVTFRLPEGARLAPNVLYTVELVVPREPGAFGFRAFDGAPIAEDTTVRFRFLTSNQVVGAALDPQAAPGCADLFGPAGRLAACALCHEPSDPPMGLDLSSAAGVLGTAIGRVAHQTETAPSTGVALEESPRFGAAMPRIDPGRPDNSYLFYKLLARPENYRSTEDELDPCATEHEAPPDPVACVPPESAELERLRAWFVRGEPMPNALGGAPPLDRTLLRDVERFIRGGAVCP